MPEVRPKNSTLSPLEQEVVDYLERNPSAADSAEGVRQWWLHKQLAIRSEALVAQALEGLVQKGVLEKRDSKFSEPVYSLSKQ